MSAILHTACTQSAEELFNIEGQAFPLSGSDPFHRNRRHRSEDRIRNLFILDPRGQQLVREFVEPNHHGAQHPLTAWGMLLVGKAQAKNGDLQGGGKSMRDGIALLASTLGVKSQRYAAGEFAYAGVLEQMGEREEASRLRRNAQATEAMLRTAR